MHRLRGMRGRLQAGEQRGHRGVQGIGDGPNDSLDGHAYPLRGGVSPPPGAADPQALHALQPSPLHQSLPGPRHVHQRGRDRGAGLSPVHRVPLLHGRLPLHGEILQLVKTGMAARDGPDDQSGRIGPPRGRGGEVHLLHSSSPNREGAGEVRSARFAGEGLPAGMCGRVPHRRDRIRRPGEQKPPGEPPRAQPPRHETAGRPGNGAESHLSERCVLNGNEFREAPSGRRPAAPHRESGEKLLLYRGRPPGHHSLHRLRLFSPTLVRAGSHGDGPTRHLGILYHQFRLFHRDQLRRDADLRHPASFQGRVAAADHRDGGSHHRDRPRDRGVKPRWLYEFLSWGWQGTERQHRVLDRAMNILMVMVIPIAVSVHTIISYIFAMTVQPGWHSTIFGPYFVVGAIFSGIAAILVLMIIFRKAFRLEAYLKVIHLQYLSMLLLIMSIIWFYFTFSEYLTGVFGNEPHEMEIIMYKFTGPFAIFFWSMVVCNFVIPMVLLSFKKFKTIAGILIASIAVVIGM